MHRCPRCSSEETRRSARRGIERVLSLVGIYPFRCERCDARFLRIGSGGGDGHGRGHGATA